MTTAEEEAIEIIDNTTNEPVDNYSRLYAFSNVVARVIKPITRSHLMSKSLTMILDSGTTHTMSGDSALFTSCSPLQFQKFVILGDGITTVPINGQGPIDCIIEGHRIILHDVFYVPAIQDTLFSIKQHMAYLNCNFHAENNTMTLKYPTFTLTA